MKKLILPILLIFSFFQEAISMPKYAIPAQVKTTMFQDLQHQHSEIIILSEDPILRVLAVAIRFQQIIVL